jgi:hypothetical protein
MNLVKDIRVVLPFCLAIASASGAPAGENYRSIALPGVKGRIDHLAIDTAGHRLFVAALGNGSLEVVDLNKGRVIRSITGLDEPQGVAYLEKGNRIVVASGGGSVAYFDGASYGLLKTVDLGSDADNVRYAAAADKIYVGFGSGGIAVLDADSGTLLHSIKLPAHPEAFEVESKGGRVFVNVPDANEVDVVDQGKRAMISRWTPGHLRSNFPMALDESARRLFVGVRRPPELRVFDTESGKSIADIPIDGDVDDVFLDAANGRVLASCGAGFLDIVPRKSGDGFGAVIRIPTAKGARTGLFLPAQAKYYLAVPANGSRSAEIREYGPRTLSE